MTSSHDPIINKNAAMHLDALQRQINTRFSEKLELIGFYQHDASIEITGQIPINPELCEASKKQLDHLRLSEKQNEIKIHYILNLDELGFNIIFTIKESIAIQSSTVTNK